VTAPEGGEGAEISTANNGNSFTISNGLARVDETMGFLYITGEVTNNSGQWARSVRIDLQIFDANGQEIYTDRVYGDPYLVPPGGKTVFGYVRNLGALNGVYASHKTEVSALVASDEQQGSVENMTIEDDGDYVIARGTIKSVGRAACYNPYTVAGIYTASGNLYRTATIYPTDANGDFLTELPVGQSASFEISLSKPVNEQFGEVKVWVSCGG
jgi:hypothetical protein